VISGGPWLIHGPSNDLCRNTDVAATRLSIPKFFTTIFGSACMNVGKTIRYRRIPRRGWKGWSFQVMMKAPDQTFDIRCSVIHAAGSRLVVLSAELRLSCP
jgi:hypothetical protein